MERLSKLLGPISKTDLGVEIGPSYNPACPKSEGWNTRTVDHADQDTLREKYREFPVDESRIEPVDFIWRDGPLCRAIPEAFHGSFDYVVASHVIEHQPDLVGFLLSVQRLIKNSGKVLLAIPDKRFCMDYFRPCQLTGEVLLAHKEGRGRHSKLSSFSQTAYSSKSDCGHCWGQHSIQDISFFNPDIEDAADAMDKLDESGAYVDHHAWSFTPSSFELIILELGALGHIDLKVEMMFPASGCEFITHLRSSEKQEFCGDKLAIRRKHLLLKHVRELAECVQFWGEPLKEIAPETPGLGIMGELRNRCEIQRQEIQNLEDRILINERSISSYKQSISSYEHSISSYENSLSWRITAPLRKLNDMIRKSG